MYLDDLTIYCATEAAVRSFTDAMRKELIATRIRVSETEFSIVRFNGDKSKADAIYKGVEPLIGDDIAEIVVFSASRRENVVIADTLVFPNPKLRLVSCTASHNLHATSPIED
ncbi:hypothetical protein PENARI_c002G01645 [Penicillium arizonense]|uniref:Uncharacterized protein n=1 Tax=Penicillium arizonense TaxID=1835702 RepID=A0A1F5LVA9_PENAI|nr:hypothetical protein PENARI_c002G01645 [Penicillium arizonense]OGE57093.1 hypothetical protein PENARI_c002G01645 [Penicillium arizonense]